MSKYTEYKKRLRQRIDELELRVAILTAENAELRIELRILRDRLSQCSRST